MVKRYKSRRRSKKYHFIRHHWFLIICTVVLIVLGMSCLKEVMSPKAASVWFETKVGNQEQISLPKDDAPHGSKMEWWYYNGHLQTESGKQYSFHDTTFQVNSVMNMIVNHVSFGDYQTGKHYTDQRSSVGSLSVDSTKSFDFVAGDWRMSGSNGVDILQAKTPNFNFDLKLVSTEIPIFQGKNGIISLGSAGNSYYYSRTRMDITGNVTINGHTEAVKGIGWFDHQWGDFSTPQLSWDWFSIQLDDHTDIMLYQLRDKSNTPVTYMGSLTKNGKTEILAMEEFTLTPSKKWISNKTGISYPIEWHLKIPKKNISVTTKSILNDSEFDATLTTYNIYWEGAIQVTGTHKGKGFMELSGYKSSIN